MRPLKQRGVVDVKTLRNRVHSVRAKERISQSDADYIDKRLEEVEARIVAMREWDEYGREVH